MNKSHIELEVLGLCVFFCFFFVGLDPLLNCFNQCLGGVLSGV